MLAATWPREEPLDERLLVLDPDGIATNPKTYQIVLGGQLGPGYIYHDSIYGSEGWDSRIAAIFTSLT